VQNLHRRDYYYSSDSYVHLRNECVRRSGKKSYVLFPFPLLACNRVVVYSQDVFVLLFFPTRLSHSSFPFSSLHPFTVVTFAIIVVTTIFRHGGFSSLQMYFVQVTEAKDGARSSFVAIFTFVLSYTFYYTLLFSLLYCVSRQLSLSKRHCKQF